jgi:hypothetical protein
VFWTRILFITCVASLVRAHAQQPEMPAIKNMPNLHAPVWLMATSMNSMRGLNRDLTVASLGPAGNGNASGQVDPSAESDRADADNITSLSSSYVPLDSWIYSAFDRLTAMGYAPSGSATIRPWTRLECARLLAEAHMNEAGSNEAALSILRTLDAEFAYETAVIDGQQNGQTVLDSVYSRITDIAGTPLRDSYHFGQTIADDFGRPYGPGANEVSGISAWGAAKGFSFYFRGEHQYAPSIGLYSPTAQSAIIAADSTFVQGQVPFGWNLNLSTTDRVRFVEAYVSANLANWQISFGQQALWWGPDRATSLILSNNAPALPMLRFARVKPIKLPGVLSWLGPLHFDSFFAREGGVHYIAQGENQGQTWILYGSPNKPLTPPPYLWGVAFSIKPTKTFELGFAHTVIFAGYGRPLNLRTFLHTFSINGNGQAVDPGKRVTEFNLNYQVPWLRKDLVVYTEGMAWDDPAEGKFVARFAMDPGLYVPHIPGLERLDLRLEGAYTDLPKLGDWAYFYANARYVQGYTNYGQIMGSWIGRQGRGGQAVSTYWFTPRSNLALSYRKMTVDKSYLQGGNLGDLSVSAKWLFKDNLELSATGQYEHWHFPLLDTQARPDFASMIELRYEPKLNLHATR